MNKTTRLLMGIFLICSCEKTKLEEDLTVLVGEWEWQETLEASCQPGSAATIAHSPSLDGYTYRLKFFKRGKVEIIKNGKKEKEYRLVFDKGPVFPQISFRLNNKKHNQFSLLYESSSDGEFIKTTTFPQEYTNESECFVQSVFKKVE